MAKREGILSRLLRDRAEAKKKEEEKLKEEASAKAERDREAYPNIDARKAARAAIGGAAKKVTGKAKTDMEDLQAKLKEAEARRKALAEKAEAREKIEEAMVKAKAAKEKAEDLKAKEKAEKDLAELRKKIEEAKAEAARQRSLAEAKKEVESMRKKLEDAKAKVEAAKEAAKASYVVKPGDSLSAIAKELMGDASLWPKLYEANKDIIGDNPNLIHPGQEFKIPDVD